MNNFWHVFYTLQQDRERRSRNRPHVDIVRSRNPSAFEFGSRSYSPHKNLIAMMNRNEHSASNGGVSVCTARDQQADATWLSARRTKLFWTVFGVKVSIICPV